MKEPAITIRSPHLEGAEVSWFAPLCNGDDEFLGHHDMRYKSDWSNTSNVLLTADRLGYRNILCPSSYQVGQDTLTFASAIAPLTSQINLLAAIRCGEVHPPMLGRAIATLDHILKGRLTINIISSDLPGTKLESLYETEQFFKARKMKANHYEIIQTYMVLGGIPFYLDLLKSQESIPQNIDRLCFDESGFLKNEFDRVFQSLFDKPENQVAIVKALGAKWKGLTRQELAKATKIPNGGGLTRILNELEKSAFIKAYYPFGKKKKGKLFRLTDNFALFHLRFIANKKLANQKGVFLKLFKQSDFMAWTGYAFENICMTHLPQIAKALRIEYILHEFSSFRFVGNEENKGIQIDLLVEREDRVINLFEIKFSNKEYRLTPDYKLKLEERSEIFAKVTKTKKSIFTALITTFGLENKADQSDVVQHVLTFEDIFAAV